MGQTESARPTMSKNELDLRINAFLEDNFEENEIARLIEKNPSDKMPWHTSAIILLQRIYEVEPEILKYVSEHALHPSCQLSFLRDVFLLRAVGLLPVGAAV